MDNLDFYIEEFQATDPDLNIMLKIIKSGITQFEESGAILAATYRRLANFREVYSRSSETYFCARKTGSDELIGGAGFGPFAGLPPEEKIGEIRELVINKEYRGFGVGRALLNKCLNLANQNGYSRIYLETTQQMNTAMQLFQKLGFSPVTDSFTSQNGDQRETQTCYFIKHLVQE